MKHILGHYTNLNALESILPKIQLRFGPFDRTNDPYENRNLEFTIWGKDDDIPYDSRSVIEGGLLRKPFKLLCFSLSDEIEFFFKRPRMWSQYADDHRGCCLILDKSKFDKSFLALKMNKSRKYKSPVNYNLDKKEKEVSKLCRQLSDLLLKADITIEAITDVLFKAKRLYLYSKMKDWEQEKEYRYCIYANDDNDIYIDISNSLREIVLGEETSPFYRKMLYTWAKEKNIDVSYIEWENGFPYKISINDSYYQTLDDIEKYKFTIPVPQLPRQ